MGLLSVNTPRPKEEGEQKKLQKKKKKKLFGYSEILFGLSYLTGQGFGREGFL